MTRKRYPRVRIIEGKQLKDIKVCRPIPFNKEVTKDDEIGEGVSVLYIPIDPNGENLVELAIIKSKGKVDLREEIPKEPKKPIEPKKGMKVKKIGVASGLTFGEIININATVYVKYPDIERKVKFVDQIKTTKMAEEGDSGSFLYTLNNEPIGLLFSISRKFTYYHKLTNVCRLLNISGIPSEFREAINKLCQGAPREGV